MTFANISTGTRVSKKLCGMIRRIQRYCQYSETALISWNCAPVVVNWLSFNICPSLSFANLSSPSMDYQMKWLRTSTPSSKHMQKLWSRWKRKWSSTSLACNWSSTWYRDCHRSRLPSTVSKQLFLSGKNCFPWSQLLVWKASSGTNT